MVSYDPIQKKSGYSEQLTWIDKKAYRVHKIEYFDRKKSLLKTLTFEGYKKYDGKFWRADKYTMTNHQTGKKTILEFSDWKFGTGLATKDFSKKALKKTR